MAWQTETVTIDSSPRSFEVFYQEAKLSCGPACVAMVNNLKYGTVTGEAIVRLWFSKVENRASDNKGGRPNRVFNWAAPSQIDTILRVLQAQKIGDNLRITEDIREAANALPHMPGILRVQWINLGASSGSMGAGGHFVVCLGRIREDSWIYLDPTHGVVVAPAAPPAYVVQLRDGTFQAGLCTHLILV